MPLKSTYIPILMRGMMSYIPIKLPSEEDMDSFQRVQMTSKERDEYPNLSLGKIMIGFMRIGNHLGHTKGTVRKYVSDFSDITGNSHAQNPNKYQTKQPPCTT